MGDTSLDEVVLPEGLTEIQANAFADSSLSAINLPSTLTSIGEGALPDPGTVMVTATEGSWAYEWALEAGYIGLQESSIDDFIIENGRIKKYIGSGGEVVIPSKDKNGNSIVSIGSNAFADCENVTRIVIPCGVKTIWEKAFYRCSKLDTVIIPNSVMYINDYAFAYCGELKTGAIPKGVVSIGSNAFLNCVKLSDVIIPDSVKEIGSYAFNGCSGFTNLVIPDSVTWIGIYAFSGCSGLTSVEIGCSSQTDPTSPVNEIDIRTATFKGCSRLTDVNISGRVVSIDSEAFCNCLELKNLTLCTGLKSIGNSAFRDCVDLAHVDIPDGVTSIGEFAFYDCKYLQSINLPDSVTNIGRNAFCGCQRLVRLEIPANVAYISTSTFGLCHNLASVVIANGVTSIGDSAFNDCHNLTSVEIPDSVVYIGRRAFYACNSLTSVVIPDGVTDIRTEAFCHCNSLESVVIPQSVTGIWSNAFCDCGSLTSVVIPDGVESIGEYAFAYCSKLNSIVIPPSVAEIDDSAFEGCNDLVAFVQAGSYAEQYCVGHGITYLLYTDGDTVGSGTQTVDGILREGDGWTIKWQITYDEDGQGNKIDAQLYIYLIGANASNGSLMLYSELDNVFLMPWLTDEYGFTKDMFTKISITGGNASPFEIVSDTFSGYVNVGLVDLKYVRIIQSHAFEGCGNLKQVNYDAKLVDIGAAAFKNCNKLIKFNGENHIIAIGDEAFENTLISSFTFEKTTMIGAKAFANTGLKRIVLWEQVSDIGEEAFDGCNDLTICCYYDSAAYNFAVSNGIGYELLDSIDQFLKNKTTKLDDSLLRITADLSLAAYTAGMSSDADVREYLRALGFNNLYSNYGGGGTMFNSGSLQFTIGTKTFNADENGNTDVLIVVAQGSKNIYELFQDMFTGNGSHRVNGYRTNDVVWDFYHDIMWGKESDGVNGIMDVIDLHKNYKVILTGHSLGGAAVNLVAAELTKTYFGRDNVYCYTFGAIDSIPAANPVSTGYENIHNVYNWSDTWSPNPEEFGSRLNSGVGSMNGKFGHIDLFDHDFRSESDKSKAAETQMIDAVNHAMHNYVAAVYGGEVTH